MSTRMRVTASVLRMHPTPDKDSPVTGRLAQNAIVEVMEPGDWRFVRTPEGLGWVHKDYLVLAPVKAPKRKWRVALSLDVLRTQVNEAAPKRSRTWDGDIGDKAHQGTVSDHNPAAPPAAEKDRTPVVRARDITHDPEDDADMAKISESLRVSRDPRISYVIFKGRIFKSYVDKKKWSAWQWQEYTGKNDHAHHMHVSVVADPALYDSEKAWSI